MDEMKKDAMLSENTMPSGMDNGGNTPADKKPKDLIKFIIPAVVCAVLVLILICVTVATGVFGNKRDVILDALGKTFSESAKAIGDTWQMDGYEDMFSEERAYMEADLTLADSMQMEMEVNMDQDLYSAYMDIGYYGFSILEADLYVDEYEVLLGMPGLLEKVFYVDRTTFDEDIERVALEYGLDETMAEALKTLNMESRELVTDNEEMELAGEQIKDAVLGILKKTEVKKADSKKLMVDGKKRSCKGYVMTITGRQAADVILACRDIYESNTAFQNYINQVLTGMEGYVSVNEMLMYEDPAGTLQRCADELMEEGDTEIYFYVCTDSSDFVFTRTGSVEGDMYLADYELETDGDELVFSVEKSKRDGDFCFNLLYDYYEMVLEGGIKETKPGSEFTFTIKTFEVDGEEILRGDILFSNDHEDEILKPEGEKVNVMDLTEDDWYEILWEISDNLYY